MTTTTDTAQQRWNKGYYDALVGMAITGIEALPPDDFGDCWIQITAKKDGETFVLELSCDEEGNGPGFIFGLPSYTLPEFRS